MTTTAPLLTEEFLAPYEAQPARMSELGAFVAYRTYTRWIDTEGRRETWKEAVARAVEYNVSIAIKEMQKNKFPIEYENVRLEAETLFDNIYNLRQFLSGRTHWVGGAKSGVAEKFPLSNFNCSFIEISKWSDLPELFYLLLVGTGVGFKAIATGESVKQLDPIRTHVELQHAEYKPIHKDFRLEHTAIETLENGFAIIRVGDSKEGWVKALELYLQVLTDEVYEPIHTVKISYNSIRPNGERLQTFGGTASGHEPLLEMFEGINKVLRNELDDTLEPLARVEGREEYGIVRPIHILDIGNLIGNNVVVGGVRRTAEIFLCDAEDWECILAKYGINGIWDEEHHNKVCMKLRDVLGYLPTWMDNFELFNPEARPLHHRRMSNNSVGFHKKPTREMLNLLFTIMQSEGEPGFVNLEEANRRRPNAKGLNPCAEILLDSYGVCNLTTVNVDAFVQRTERVIEELEEAGLERSEYALDFAGLAQAQALSTRAGLRMTCLDLELPHWDAVHKRDRLIGTSLTGWKDAIAKLGYGSEQEYQLLNILEKIVNDEVLKYATLLRIPLPLVSTTIKPEGTLSQVAGGVSSGLHHSHSPFYIRRIRVNASDSLAKLAVELDWTVNPEVGTEDPKNPRTLVIDFPVASGATKTKDDVYVDEQFDTYFAFQEHYTQHNSSNTIHLRPDEWERAEERVWEGWDSFVGVSFLAYDGGSYALAPYEAITEEQYHELKAKMKPFSYDLLVEFEGKGLSDLEEDTVDCSTGACPTR